MTLLEKSKAFPVEIYSRVTGWLVAKSAANPGKQAEWGDRKQYKNISGGNSSNL